MSKRIIWTVLLCVGAGAGELRSQPVFVGTPAGVKLEVQEKAIDLARFNETTLHLTLVNDSTATLHLKALPWLQGRGRNNGYVGCQRRESAAAEAWVNQETITLTSGKRYAMTLPLREVFCLGANDMTALYAVIQARVESAQVNGDAQVGSAEMTLTGRLPDALAIRFVLEEQQKWWNQGSLDNFAKGYKDSPDILFIGSNVRRGYAEMLAGYKASYADYGKMGHLTFSDLEVQPMSEQFATATGRFALARTRENGGNASGFFLLVLEKTAEGWKIIRDDTTADPPPK